MSSDFDEDIYGDLNEFSEEQLAIPKVSELQEKLEKSVDVIKKLKAENASLAKDKSILEKNFSCLLNTARHEIRRKDSQIMCLNKTLTNMRISGNRNKIPKDDILKVEDNANVDKSSCRVTQNFTESKQVVKDQLKCSLDSDKNVPNKEKNIKLNPKHITKLQTINQPDTQSVKVDQNVILEKIEENIDRNLKELRKISDSRSEVSIGSDKNHLSKESFVTERAKKHPRNPKTDQAKPDISESLNSAGEQANKAVQISADNKLVKGRKSVQTTSIVPVCKETLKSELDEIICCEAKPSARDKNDRGSRQRSVFERLENAPSNERRKNEDERRERDKRHWKDRLGDRQLSSDRRIDRGIDRRRDRLSDSDRRDRTEKYSRGLHSKSPSRFGRNNRSRSPNRCRTQRRSKSPNRYARHNSYGRYNRSRSRSPTGHGRSRGRSRSPLRSERSRQYRSRNRSDCRQPMDECRRDSRPFSSVVDLDVEPKFSDDGGDECPDSGVDVLQKDPPTVEIVKCENPEARKLVPKETQISSAMNISGKKKRRSYSKDGKMSSSTNAMNNRLVADIDCKKAFNAVGKNDNVTGSLALEPSLKNGLVSEVDKQTTPCAGAPATTLIAKCRKNIEDREDGEMSDSDSFEEAGGPVEQKITDMPQNSYVDWLHASRNTTVRRNPTGTAPPVKTLFTVRMEQKLKRDALETEQQFSPVVDEAINQRSIVQTQDKLLGTGIAEKPVNQVTVEEPHKITGVDCENRSQHLQESNTIELDLKVLDAISASKSPSLNCIVEEADKNETKKCKNVDAGEMPLDIECHQIFANLIQNDSVIENQNKFVNSAGNEDQVLKESGIYPNHVDSLDMKEDGASRVSGEMLADDKEEGEIVDEDDTEILPVDTHDTATCSNDPFEDEVNPEICETNNAENISPVKNPVILKSLTENTQFPHDENRDPMLFSPFKIFNLITLSPVKQCVSMLQYHLGRKSLSETLSTEKEQQQIVSKFLVEKPSKPLSATDIFSSTGDDSSTKNSPPASNLAKSCGTSYRESDENVVAEANAIVQTAVDPTEVDPEKCYQCLDEADREKGLSKYEDFLSQHLPNEKEPNVSEVVHSENANESNLELKNIKKLSEIAKNVAEDVMQQSAVVKEATLTSRRQTSPSSNSINSASSPNLNFDLHRYKIPKKPAESTRKNNYGKKDCKDNKTISVRSKNAELSRACDKGEKATSSSKSSLKERTSLRESRRNSLSDSNERTKAPCLQSESKNCCLKNRISPDVMMKYDSIGRNKNTKIDDAKKDSTSKRKVSSKNVNNKVVTSGANLVAKDRNDRNAMQRGSADMGERMMTDESKVRLLNANPTITSVDKQANKNPTADPNITKKVEKTSSSEKKSDTFSIHKERKRLHEGSEESAVNAKKKRNFEDELASVEEDKQPKRLRRISIEEKMWELRQKATEASTTEEKIDKSEQIKIDFNVNQSEEGHYELTETPLICSVQLKDVHLRNCSKSVVDQIIKENKLVDKPTGKNTEPMKQQLISENQSKDKKLINVNVSKEVNLDSNKGKSEKPSKGKTQRSVNEEKQQPGENKPVRSTRSKANNKSNSSQCSKTTRKKDAKENGVELNSCLSKNDKDVKERLKSPVNENRLKELPTCHKNSPENSCQNKKYIPETESAAISYKKSTKNKSTCPKNPTNKNESAKSKPISPQTGVDSTRINSTSNEGSSKSSSKNNDIKRQNGAENSRKCDKQVVESTETVASDSENTNKNRINCQQKEDNAADAIAITNEDTAEKSTDCDKELAICNESQSCPVLNCAEVQVDSQLMELLDLVMENPGANEVEPPNEVENATQSIEQVMKSLHDSVASDGGSAVAGGQRASSDDNITPITTTTTTTTKIITTSASSSRLSDSNSSAKRDSSGSIENFEIFKSVVGNKPDSTEMTVGERMHLQADLHLSESDSESSDSSSDYNSDASAVVDDLF